MPCRSSGRRHAQPSCSRLIGRFRGTPPPPLCSVPLLLRRWHQRAAAEEMQGPEVAIRVALPFLTRGARIRSSPRVLVVRHLENELLASRPLPERKALKCPFRSSPRSLASLARSCRDQDYALAAAAAVAVAPSNPKSHVAFGKSHAWWAHRRLPARHLAFHHTWSLRRGGYKTWKNLLVVARGRGHQFEHVAAPALGNHVAVGGR